ncbi:right-handed parallel beta-helix repeat-containing protein [Cerasicoccus frondis]|uniref:right-handed parallel beta-helix repeat-containing protein n=1 Tax=Cerasicoccus frondis TaxID=490090 RepID=UPI002852C57C|nr:right-handed parallel beta-helix repeat-containing protein [Cerasicoccus frondis]
MISPTKILQHGFSAAAFATAITLTTVNAGNLTPPAGAPESTMKTLDEIEPRTPIDPSGEYDTIDESGSYYLTGPYTDSRVVTISASNVKLDLGGFSHSVEIVVGAHVQNVSVENGAVNNIQTSHYIDVRFDKLAISTGVSLAQGGTHEFYDCSFSDATFITEAKSLKLDNCRFVESGIEVNGEETVTLLNNCVFTDCDQIVGIQNDYNKVILQNCVGRDIESAIRDYHHCETKLINCNFHGIYVLYEGSGKLSVSGGSISAYDNGHSLIVAYGDTHLSNLEAGPFQSDKKLQNFLQHDGKESVVSIDNVRLTNFGEPFYWDSDARLTADQLIAEGVEHFLLPPHSNITRSQVTSSRYDSLEIQIYDEAHVADSIFYTKGGGMVSVGENCSISDSRFTGFDQGLEFFEKCQLNNLKLVDCEAGVILSRYCRVKGIEFLGNVSVLFTATEPFWIEDCAYSDAENSIFMTISDNEHDVVNRLSGIKGVFGKFFVNNTPESPVDISDCEFTVTDWFLEMPDNSTIRHSLLELQVGITGDGALAVIDTEIIGFPREQGSNSAIDFNGKLTMDRCHIQGFESGIYADEVVIQNSTLIGTHNSGIGIYSNAYSIIRNNSISEYEWGIQLGGGRGGLIQGNSIQSESVGIHADTQTPSIISQNTIYAVNTGIETYSNNQIVNNQIVSARGLGIYLKESGNTITGNIITSGGPAIGGDSLSAQLYGPIIEQDGDSTTVDRGKIISENPWANVGSTW